MRERRFFVGKEGRCSNQRLVKAKQVGSETKKFINSPVVELILKRNSFNIIVSLCQNKVVSRFKDLNLTPTKLFNVEDSTSPLHVERGSKVSQNWRISWGEVEIT
jgi:hypothetical protein